MLEIYNHYVANSTVTFDEDPLTLKELRAKFRHTREPGYPWLVAESPGGQVLGYAYVSRVEAQGRVPLHGRGLDLPGAGLDRQGSRHGAAGGTAHRARRPPGSRR